MLLLRFFYFCHLRLHFQNCCLLSEMIFVLYLGVIYYTEQLKCTNYLYIDLRSDLLRTKPGR